MAISLHNIKPAKGSKTLKKRVGRGLGSKGTTAGRGQKGQRSRSGVGGMQRIGLKKLLLATPKLRGFKSGKAKFTVVNLEDISKAFIKGEIVSPETLKQKKLVANTKNGIKLLGDGDISVAVTVKGCKVSKAAAEKITKAGGSVEA